MTHLREMLHQPSVVLVGWSLVHFLWQGVLVALVVAAVLRANRNSSAETRYAVAGTGLLVMLACPIITFLVMSAATPSIAADTSPVFQPGSASGGDAGPALSAPLALWTTLAQLPQRFPADRLLPLLVSIWAVGVAVLAIRLLLGYLQISFVRTTALPVDNHVIRARLADLSRRMGITRPVALLESALAPGPAVIGVLRPAILFPAAALTGLWPIQIEAILAHELAHVRRHDYLVNLLQSVVETLLFYHPAVWWVSKKIRQEREHCCDDLAVQACGDRRFYANCLADLDELRPAQLALAMGAAGGTGLLPRIRRILCLPGRENRAASAAAGTLLVAATGTALMVLAGTPVARAEPTIHPTTDTATPNVVAVSLLAPSSSLHPNQESEPSNESTHQSDIELPAPTSNADAHPVSQPPPLPPIDVRLPDLSMSEVVSPAPLPKPFAAPQPQQPTPAKTSPKPHANNRPLISDFPPITPQSQFNPTRSPAPTAANPNFNMPPATNTPRTATRRPRIINFNGLLFIPDDFVAPADTNYIRPNDHNYVTPQSPNYITPQRNFVTPSRTYIAPHPQAAGPSSANNGRMTPSPSQGNYVRPSQTK